MSALDERACLLRHATNAIIARGLIASNLRENDNCPPSKAVQIAAFDCLNESATMTLAAFLEGAEDACHLKPSTVRQCWYRGQREWRDALEFAA